MGKVRKRIMDREFRLEKVRAGKKVHPTVRRKIKQRVRDLILYGVGWSDEVET